MATVGRRRMKGVLYLKGHLVYTRDTYRLIFKAYSSIDSAVEDLEESPPKTLESVAPIEVASLCWS